MSEPGSESWIKADAFALAAVALSPALEGDEAREWQERIRQAALNAELDAIDWPALFRGDPVPLPQQQLGLGRSDSHESPRHRPV